MAGRRCRLRRRGWAAGSLAGSMLLFGCTLIEQSRAASPAEELVILINAHRSTPQKCDGRRQAAVGPLTHEPALDRLEFGAGASSLEQALKARGYQASRVRAVTMTGPSDAKTAMQMLVRQYCQLLSSPSFAEIGVGHQGANWRVVFAQPLLSADLGAWQQAGRQVLERVNAARAVPRRCGAQRFGPAPPLRWNERLAAAALTHSQDMAKNSYLAHQGRDGSQAGDRAERHGYDWRRIGENIASGQGSAEKVVAGWLTSPAHCRNVMEPDFAEMGAAYVMHPGSDHGIYWTQVFGTRR